MSWMRTLALVVKGMMKPSGSYRLARGLYMFLKVGSRVSTGQTLQPRESLIQFHRRPKVESCRLLLP